MARLLIRVETHDAVAWLPPLRALRYWWVARRQLDDWARRSYAGITR